MFEGDSMKKSALKYVDYNHIKFTYMQLFMECFKGVCLIAVISYLFYRSVIAFVSCLPLLILFLKYQKTKFINKRKQNLQIQFKEGITVLLSGLEAGYSIENAFEDACGELRQMYEKETDIEKEFQNICCGVRLNEPIEEMIMNFASRSHIDDIKSFAQVFMIAKKRGGDMPAVLKSSIGTIHEKLEVRQEIDTILSGKKLEHSIMSVVPAAILFYVNLTSPEFTEVLYSCIAGRIVMTICLIVYIISIIVGRKIVDIEI